MILTTPITLLLVLKRGEVLQVCRDMQPTDKLPLNGDYVIDV
jgi:hypothetical protein